MNAIENSRRGYLGSLTRIYNQLDVLLSSYDNVVEVKEFHTKLRSAWLQYESCCAQCLTQVNKETELYKRISAQYEDQMVRKRNYDTIVEQYLSDSVVHFNTQVMEDMTRTKPASGSVRSDVSRISIAMSKLREANLAASKATLIGKQTENRKKRALQLVLAKMEMELKRKELEYTNSILNLQILRWKMRSGPHEITLS